MNPFTRSHSSVPLERPTLKKSDLEKLDLERSKFPRRSAVRGGLRLLLISRPALWVNTLGTATVALWLSGRLWSVEPLWWVTLLWLTLPFNLLIYGVNDIADQREDALSSRKGGLQGARLAVEEDKRVARAILWLNLPFGLYFLLEAPLTAWLWMLLYTVVFVAYSLPPVRFKARPFLDSLSNAAYALPLAFVPALFGETPPPLALLGLMAWSVGKHAFDAVQDMESDARAGVFTLALKLGARGTALWCLCWFALSSILFWSLHPLVSLAVLGVSGGLTLNLMLSPRSSRAARLYPLSVLSPWPLGMVAGVLLVAHLVRG
ncbi:MAG: UbiA family prenyltransferase [Pseudopedobacter sp.]|nr:UbiA family prenyltransferase [Deinococcales bacterium]